MTRMWGGKRENVTGVVVEPGQDLGVRVVGERVMGEVGLPALVRQVGGEPQVGRFRGGGHDQSVAGQVAADGRGRDPDPGVVVQVPGDGVPPGVLPYPARSLRSRTISSTVPGLITDGEVLDRRDRGSNAASPSAW